MEAGVITVNTPQEYHNCSLLFSFEYTNPDNGFSVDSEQLYKIHTTLKEVEALNEALAVYQKPGFKENFLLYTSVQDGSNKYPNFVFDYMDAVESGKRVQYYANDEDSLVQLSSYCMETAPTYEDDFKINKHLHVLEIDDKRYELGDYEECEEFFEDLREKSPHYFQ